MQTWEDDKADSSPRTMEKLCDGLISGDLSSDNYEPGMHIAELAVLHGIDDATFMENLRVSALETPRYYADPEEAIRAIVNTVAIAVTRRRLLLSRAQERGHA